MNRFRKEEQIKQEAILENCTPLEIQRFEYEKAIQAKIFELARAIHMEEFKEEDDYQLDSIADTKDRSRGINPMNRQHIERTNKKRTKRGVAPLCENGMPVSDDTWKIAYADAERTMRDD